MRNTSLIAVQKLHLICCLALVPVSQVAFTISAHGGEPSAPTAGQVVPETTVGYSIIVTGNELLSGVYADGHTVYLTKTLRPLGLHCIGSVSVDDQADDIRQALRFTLSRSNLVIVTGGLGPTESDITRDVLSAYTGIELREQPDVLRAMERRFGAPRDQLRANLRRQTRVPVQGTYLPNTSGTAVGLVFEQEDKVIVALPGPPRELQPMVQDHLIPYLANKFGVHTLGCALTVRFVGLGQSQIDQTMKDHIRLPADTMQTSQFESGRVDFTFALPGDSPEDHQRLELLRRELHKYMDDHIYADDATTTLEAAAIQRLSTKGQTVVLVELASGGTVAAGFAQTPRGRQVLAGGFIATTPDQLRRILQIPADPWSAAAPTSRLELLAKAAQQRVQSDWALVVGPPEPREGTGETQVHILIRAPRGKLVHRSWPWRDSSPANLTRLATQLFDLLRQVAAAESDEGSES